MDGDVIKLFGVMLAIMIPLGLGGGVFIIVASLSKGFRRRRTQQATSELEQLRDRVEELERREDLVRQLEERLDFLERMVPALRETKHVRANLSSQKDPTPV